MTRRAFSGLDSRVPAGLALAALGVVLTELSYSVRDSWSVQRFWPLLVVGFGVSRLAEPAGRVAGWVLIVVGAALQLANLGVFVLPAREVVRYWPVVVMLAGLQEMLRSRGLPAKVEGLAAAFLGLWLQLSYFGAPHIGSYRPWPLLLLAFGALMAWRGSYAQSSV